MAESAIGVTLQYSTNDGTDWSSAGCILEVDMGGLMRDVKESTCISQTSLWKTFFGAFADAGEITATIDWSKTGFQTLMGMMDDTSTIDWRIVVPDGSDPATPTTCTRLSFEGLLTKLGLGFPSDGDRIKVPMTVKLSGAPTLTLAS
jgi:hypothetical protein